MVAPKVDEVSGVDRAANRHQGWLMLKSESGENMDLSAEDRAGLSEPVLKYLESLETAVTKSEDDAAGDADLFEKSISALPAPVRTQLLKQQRESAEAVKIAKSLQEEKATDKFEKQARSLVNLPGVSAATATVLRKSHDADPEAYEDLFKVLKAADNAIGASGLWREIGTGQGDTAGSASGSIEALAKSLMEKDPTLTSAAAIEKAAMENPELASQHRSESLRKNALQEA
jgi:hypothetical protein